MRISKAGHPIILFIINFFLSHPALAQQKKEINKKIIAFTHATIYQSPVDAVIKDGTVIIEDEKITAVGKRKKIKIPKGAEVINCKGLTITAGFWNSHVHFTDRKVSNSKEMADKELADYLKQFLTMYGVTYAFDIGSFPENTLAIKQRIENGSVSGPFIFTTGAPLAPPNGTPFYLKSVGITLPELNSTGMATGIVTQFLNSGVDGIKMFAASPVERGKDEVLMPENFANAVTKAAHEKKKPVFAHPSVNGGLQVAIKSGVDIIAHTTPDGGKTWDSVIIKQMLANNVYVIPTLKLWKWSLQNDKQSQDRIDKFTAVAIEQTRAFHAAGGKILFGTDIGFMNDFNPVDEYICMQQAGMSFRQILASMTTIPAEKFGQSNQTGKVAKGMNADLVIFSGNPESDIKALTDVVYTIRKGKIIYKKQ